MALSGYGSKEFDGMAAAKTFIRDKFVASKIGAIEANQDDDFRGHAMITARNNFFTAKDKVKYEMYNPYPEEDDPQGALHRCALTAEQTFPVVRIKENEVLYFDKETKEYGDGVV